MTASFAPPNPGFADRVRRSFERQAMMRTLAASLTRVEAGEAEIAMPVVPAITQQHGFVHAGAVAAIGDTACGYAALTLMPPTAGILTTEFKINLLAPAAGERLIAVGRVIKPGRTLTVAQAKVHAEAGGGRKLVALMIATLMAVEGRAGVAD